MVNATVPSAFPDWPDLIAIHGALLVAFQVQPVNVLTVTDNPPPPGPIASRVRLRLYRHGAAAWDTSTVCEPTTMLPERAVGTGLAATV
jgi:hypothetical protein